MEAPGNYPECATEGAPEADSNCVSSVKAECELKFNNNFKRTVIIRNTNNKVLMIDAYEKKAVFEEMTDSAIKANADQTHFIMKHYRMDADCKGSHVVTISTMPSNKTYTMSCKEKHVFFKEGAAPDDITGVEKDILFCKETVTGFNEKTEFKSLLYPQYYLACEKDDKGLYQLILKERDENDRESTKFIVQNIEKMSS